MKIKSIAFLAFLIISVFTGCEDKGKIPQDIAVAPTTQTKQTQAQPTKEPESPSFKLVTSTGDKLTILAKKDGWKFQGYENKVILLDFFGTWCPPCKAEIPHLNNIREKLKDKFEIIGVDVGPRGGGDTPKETLDAFIKEFKIKYPIAVTSTKENGKLFGAVGELNRNGSIPFMILFNTKGQYLTHYVGMVPEEMLYSDIKKALEQ